MGTLLFEGSELSTEENETVLDCLLRQKIKVTNSCKSGICQSCLLKSNSELDASSQKGLSASKKQAGLFLSCQQRVTSGLEVFLPDTSTLLVDGRVISQERISNSVVVLKIKTLSKYSFKAGQFTNIIRDDGLCRSYSIASQTGSDELEFHIRKVPNGELSTWLYDNDLINKRIKLSEAMGECCLNDDMNEKDLLLVGVGTGLAPLYGVLRDSIVEKKMGSVQLIHGGLTVDSLYLVENLKSIEQKIDFFSYYPVFLKGEEKEGFLKGDLVELIKKFDFDKSKTIVMICGDPLLVKSIKQEVFLSGVSSKHILSDPFISHVENREK
jgi:NAD(P)H-flavin reductase/ferredoxin